LKNHYRPDIDGLRAVAILSVVAFHTFPKWITGGFIGVDIFFVISGFLISKIILERIDQGLFNFLDFYTRRIKRIFPSLILVLTVCIVLGWLILTPSEYKQLGHHVAAGAGFLSNYLLWSESGYFDNPAELKPLLNLWSLAVEEQFYLVWPFLLFAARRIKVNLALLITTIIIISFYLNIIGIKQDAVATFYLLKTRFWEFLCGGLLAVFAIYKDKIYLNTKKSNNQIKTISNRKAFRLLVKMVPDVIACVGLSILIYGFTGSMQIKAFRVNGQLSQFWEQ
jgi:peptidoglycan/LPS O-acetylase OafA/YrhL